MAGTGEISRFVRTRIARLFIVVMLLSAVVGYYFITPTLDTVNAEFNIWNMVIVSFTMFIGLITIYASYGRTIAARSTNWPFRLYALILIPIWIIMGLTSGIYSDLYQTAFLSTKITLHIAILGQLIFFYLSAMYRTFRIKTARTAILVIGALVMIILNSPITLSGFSVADQISYWLLNNPGMGGARAVVLAAGVGGVILAIRVLLGLEKGALRATGGG